MSFNQQTNDRAVQRLAETWGGRLPTWEEFMDAYRGGRVKVNKTIAAQAIHWKGMPVHFMVIYGIVTGGS